jgi:outer membrane protein
MGSATSFGATIIGLNMKKTLIISILLLIAASANAQIRWDADTADSEQSEQIAAAEAGQPEMQSDTAQADGLMTLKECMVYAISNSTKVRIQQAAIGDARIDRRDAILSAFTPRISSQTYAYYNFGRSIDPQTNTYFNTTSFYNGYSASTSFTLFNGFEAVNNLKISKTSLAMGKTQEKQVEADICLAVMEAYYNVVYYTKLKEAYEDQVATAEQSLKLAKRQEELGQKGHADVVQMEADLADRQYDLTSAQTQLNTQMLNLQDLMFWPLDSTLNIFTDIEDIDEFLPSGDEDEISEYARTNDPEVKVAGWKVSNAKHELNTARWQIFPSLTFYAGWSTTYYTYKGTTTDPFGDQFKNNGGEYVQLSLSIPIFDRLSRHSTIAKKKNALATATAEYDQKCREIDSEVRRAIQDSEDALDAWHQACKKEELQDEAYHLNSRKLEQGLISPIEFRTASDNYIKAKADKYNSLYKCLIKQSVVRYYGGEEYINQL